MGRKQTYVPPPGTQPLTVTLTVTLDAARVGQYQDLQRWGKAKDLEHYLGIGIGKDWSTSHDKINDSLGVAKAPKMNRALSPEQREKIARDLKKAQE